jgi:catechol 2,3-dioxygenase-like lactoylglutathione lyase family enzyme
MRSETLGQLSNALDRFLAALANDIRGPELSPERNPLGVVAKQDDLLGAQALGCNHAAETDGAVADDGDRFPRPDLGGDCGVVARSHHIREREHRRHQGVVSADRQHDERSVRLRNAYSLALTAVDVIEAVPASAETFALQPLPAENACSVGPQKRRHDEVAAFDRVDFAANVFDHPDEFVAHTPARFGRFHRLVGPQVAPADRRVADTPSASVALIRWASGTVSTRTSPAPYSSIARMAQPNLVCSTEGASAPNNAGISGGRISPSEVTADQMRMVYETNVFGSVRVSSGVGSLNLRLCNMNVLFIASVAVVVADPLKSRKLFVNALGLALEGEGDGYYSSEQIAGSNHFGVWPLSQAAEACFGIPEWPADRVVPQASIEFEVEDAEAVAAAAGELQRAGFELLHPARTEPWGQTVTRLLTEDGLIIGISYIPSFHDQQPA